MTQHLKHNFIGLGLFAVILALDQFVKYRAILRFDYFLNDGFVFGLIRYNLFGIIASIILILVSLWLIFVKKVAFYPLAVVTAGISSNMIDRFFYKGVIDYWSFFNLFWFNLADVFIIIVVVAGLITYFYTKKLPPLRRG